jgi:putative membrane protein insertion efficiency factor
VSAPMVTASGVSPLGPDRGASGLGQRFLARLIKLYQGIRAGKPSPCRFVPSCSDYALEAIESHGAWRGGWLAARRVGRCRPWGGSGVDLVPERRDVR